MDIVTSSVTSPDLPRTWMWLAGLVLALMALAPAGGGAEPAESGKFTYRGVTVERAAGLYLVTQETYARETPDNSGKRRDLIEEGTKVRAFAKSAGAWLAVKHDDGKELGFLPLAALHVLFDGALDSDLTGDFTLASGRKCSYTIHYTGSSPIEGESLETSDYDVTWRCTIGETVREFSAFAFVTEAADVGRKDPVYQLTMDIWEIAGEAQDQVFSTTMMYDQQRGRVSFDSLSIPSFAADKVPAPQAAKTVPDILRKGLEIAVSSWNADAWNAVGGIAK